MDGQAEVLGVGADLDRVHGLGDQLAGVGPDDARAEQPSRLGLDEQLREAVVAALGQRASRRRQRCAKIVPAMVKPAKNNSGTTENKVLGLSKARNT